MNSASDPKERSSVVQAPCRPHRADRQPPPWRPSWRAETYISPTRYAPVLKSVIENYMAKFGITLKPEYEADNLTSTMSLVASTGGVTVLPIYARHVLSPSVVLRPLKGEPPMIDLVIGYNRSNTSPLLKRFLARADELVAAVARRTSSDL
jgi:LysR family hca operon transcriptional activator